MNPKILNSFVLLLFFIGVAQAQVTFQKTFGGTDGDLAKIVKQTNDGGYAILAESSSFSSFGTDNYLLRTDSIGNVIWKKSFGSIYFDYVRSMCLTNLGEYVVAGVQYNPPLGSDDIYVTKIDTNGNLLWGKIFSASDTDYVASIQTTSDGGFIVSGTTKVQSSFDIYLIKTDSSGNLVWAKTYGGTGHDGGSFAKQTADGGYIIGGITTSFGAGADDICILKTDNNGNVIWSKTFGGINIESCSAVLQTNDEGYIIGGITSSFGSGYGDFYLVKTDSSGNLLWSKTYGTIGYDNNLAFNQTIEQGFILVGNLHDTGFVDVDAYLINTDISGNLIWSKKYGGTNLEYGYFVQQTIDRGYIIAGLTESFGAVFTDIYLVKTDSLGNSGCNESIVATSITNPATITSNPIITFGTPITTVNTFVTFVDTGGTETTLCTNVGIQPVIISVQSTIMISPNPFNSSALLQVSSEFQNASMEIYNSLGLLLKKAKMSYQTLFVLNRNELPPGIYFLRLINDKRQTVTEKFIVD